MTRQSLVLSIVLTSCADPTRFADRDVLWQEPERPTPKPHRRDQTIAWAGTRDAIVHPANHLFGLDYGREAEDVNALDEVPDSSWFVDPRRDCEGGRPRALDDRIAAGAVQSDDRPEPPFTIRHGKRGGSSLGFVVDDARGVRYMLKFDPRDRAGLVTSTEVVVTRLAWASGWRVPSEQIVDVRSEDLHVAPGAWAPDPYDRRKLIDTNYVVNKLQEAARLPDGRLRAVASRWIEGDIIGNFAWYGREKQDLNDTIDHQNRRSLRGFGVWASWVDNVDTMENNTLDTYVDSRVLHYQQDVGGSFGTFAGRQRPYFLGYESFFAPARIFGSFFSLGAMPRRWQGRTPVNKFSEIGDFEAASFDPGHWRAILDNPAFVRQTARDRYWGAKRVIAFNQNEVRSAISAGRYSAEAADYLYRTLWTRRERIARAWLSPVAPLDYFQFHGDRLCFADLWIDAGLGGEGGTDYSAHEQSTIVSRDRCVPIATRSGYRIIELRARRPGERRFGPAVAVHFIEDSRGRRIVGVAR